MILWVFNFYGGQAESKPLPKGKTAVAVLKTNRGEISMLLSNRTPIHRDNFIKLARTGFYEGILFHRVIPGFVIQAGDPETKEARPGVVYGSEDVGYRLNPEIMDGLYHIRGMVGAAREGDAENPERLSSGSHFYIVVGYGKEADETMVQKMEQKLTGPMDSVIRKSYLEMGGAPHLDGHYTLFGYVFKGMEVVDAIAAETTGEGDRPLQDIQIVSVKIKKIKNKKLKELCYPELKNF